MPPALPSGKSLDNLIAARAMEPELVLPAPDPTAAAFKRKIYLRRDPEPPAKRVHLDYRHMVLQPVCCPICVRYLVPWVWAISRARVPQPTEHKTGCTFLEPSAGLRYESPTVVDEDLGISSVYIWDIRRYRAHPPTSACTAHDRLSFPAHHRGWYTYGASLRHAEEYPAGRNCWPFQNQMPIMGQTT
ncbi:uncharacterized protein F5891DRAFT_976541 [Suillus fuscotomentosus]|uniref:Uncharacterized protein n=1 Tax=Suillus fuscotomentosus TaxID=1912939 RepID=A0AAD4EEV8_9AGAM|nr:uncharacterized protein F5891DRAFT_976541 [Suillus fuscotomentosus]KAG1904960.1 hypothetical protein F5891DRAFT_976541 [Suillus fuscotomentosus]